MKKNFRKILSILLIVIVLVSCFTISASAATASTNTYYVYQQETRGQLTLTTTTIGVSTYCELKSAGKIAKADCMMVRNGYSFPYSIEDGGRYDYDTYEDTSSANYVLAQESLEGNAYFLSAQSFHKVKINSYITWDSAECDGDTIGYDIPTINL